MSEEKKPKIIRVGHVPIDVEKIDEIHHLILDHKLEEEKKPKIDVLIVGMGHVPMGAGKVELIESLMKNHNVEMLAFDDPRLKDHAALVLDEARLIERPPMKLEVPIHEVKRISYEPTSGREERNKRRKEKRTKRRRY